MTLKRWVLRTNDILGVEVKAIAMTGASPHVHVGANRMMRLCSLFFLFPFLISVVGFCPHSWSIGKRGAAWIGRPVTVFRVTPENEGDDGWNVSGQDDKKNKNKINNDNSKDLRMQELSILQEQRQKPSTLPKPSEIAPRESVPSSSSSSSTPERDLFIPIFTAVAITGFFGAYAYETFRLYARGELYLPF